MSGDEVSLIDSVLEARQEENARTQLLCHHEIESQLTCFVLFVSAWCHQEQPVLNPREQLVKEKSMTMEYFLESRNLDKITEEMLRKYDKDGDGAFSKDEVVSIIIDLRQEHVDNDKLSATNKLYKRLLLTAIILCVLLLAGMFALSYAVAALTAKTDVKSDGTMVAIGTNTAVATDSRAEVHSVAINENGLYCITLDEAELMRMEVATGRNVMLDKTDGIGQQTATVMSSSGTFDLGDKICFALSPTQTVCWSPTDDCTPENTSGRRLSEDERLSLGMRPRRRLGAGNDEGVIDPLVSTIHACFERVPGNKFVFAEDSCGCPNSCANHGGACKNSVQRNENGIVEDSCALSGAPSGAP
jgi:hypothetical protein